MGWQMLIPGKTLGRLPEYRTTAPWPDTSGWESTMDGCQPVEGCRVRICVAILSSHSLFAEGIISRLRQYLHDVEFAIVDPRRPDVLAQIAAVCPTVVLLDVTDPAATQLCPLSKLLLAFPELKVIRLDQQHEQIQVLTSRRRPAVRIRDLVEVIVANDSSDSEQAPG